VQGSNHLQLQLLSLSLLLLLLLCRHAFRGGSPAVAAAAVAQLCLLLL
jgi:hypothetical protein